MIKHWAFKRNRSINYQKQLNLFKIYSKQIDCFNNFFNCDFVETHDVPSSVIRFHKNLQFVLFRLGFWIWVSLDAQSTIASY